MKVDVDCIMRNGEVEIGISLVERISQQEFEEYADTLRREGFEYDSYNQSNFFTTKTPRMLAAMLKFLDKEYQVEGKLRGKKVYSWEERDQFVKDFEASLVQPGPEPDAEPSHTHTEPSHTHTEPSHTHTEPSHTHTEPSHTHTEP
ncbi:MAG: hypothetical protein HXS52_13855 [Theionarchaea archaeon]|nr:hypothetical protein [Theionarchaea archaeon]MBU7039007.1 hypothetical protein [Theionarchaea archaeon]